MRPDSSHYYWVRIWTLLLFIALSNQALADIDFTVKSRFENWIVVPPDVSPLGSNSSSAVFFVGNNQPRDVPDLQNVVLESSSFGQPFAAQIPFAGFIRRTLTSGAEKLYYDQAPPEKKDLAAFRYRALLYAQEDVEGETFIRAQFENISDYWNDGARQRAMMVADSLVNAVRYAPWDRNLRNALLDIYYDIAVADRALANEKAVEVAEIILDFVSGEFLIDREITKLEDALLLYRSALLGYMTLLQERFGVDVSEFESRMQFLDEPFGYYVFREEVPSRSPLAALFKNGAGDWVLPIDAGDGDTQELLFTGYKDVTLLFELQRDYLRTALDLAKRYVMRGLPADQENPSDIDKAKQLIGNVTQASYLEGNALIDLFPEIAEQGIPDDPIDPASGLRDAVASWRHAFRELSYLRSLFRGDGNILGFADDFLVLTQSVIPGDSQSEYFDTFDFLANYLNSETANGPLSIARVDYADAKVDYANYRDRNDQLANEYFGRREQYNERLRQIVGVNPGEPGYDDPTGHEGGLLYDQVRNVELAHLRIAANEQEIDNLRQQVQIEIWRRGEEAGINNAIEQVYVDYGNKYAGIASDIGQILAEQAAANEIAAAFSNITTSTSFGLFGPEGEISIGAGFYAHLANSVVQYSYEREKKSLNVTKEKLVARQQAKIQSLQDGLLDINSRAQIKTWLLQMNMWAIESAELAIELSQEVGRLKALFDEKDDLERRAEESNELLADRYFADPAHRLVKNASVLKSRFSFDTAQRWLFLATRAGEYKWNQDFQFTAANGITYTKQSLFGLRNAKELKDYFDALTLWNNSISIGQRSEDGYKKFSIRRDFMGFRDSGQYFDPITGTDLISPIEAFQKELSKEKYYLDGDDPDNPLPGFKALKISFNTAFIPEEGGLFLRNRWLEKINFLRVKLFGGTDGGIESTLDGALDYGGVSLIRTQSPGMQDPENPDRWINEMREYSTRYYYFKDGEWRSEPSFRAPITVQISNDPDPPPEVYKINIFKEYSTATTQWTLYVVVESPGGFTLVDVDTLSDIEFHLSYFYYAPRS